MNFFSAMDPARLTVVLVLLQLLIAWDLTIALHQLLRIAHVSRNITGLNIKMSHFTGSMIQAAFACTNNEECYTFCETNPGEFLLIQMKVVPYNEDPNGPPYMNCFTNREPSLLTAQSGVTIHAATPTYALYPKRVASNLLIGYCYAISDSMYITRVPNAFVVFDLGSTYKIRNVTILSEAYDAAVWRFKDIEVRVGSSPQTGDFTSYTLLGAMPFAAPHGWYEFHTDAPVAVAGRYVSVQSKETVNEFMICSVEISVE